MCQKRQRRCPALLQIREDALQEWTKAETFADVCRAWGRLGGRVTLHRYGAGHFALLARHRHDDPEALGLLTARMQRRSEQARGLPERVGASPFRGQYPAYCDDPTCGRCFSY
jgi:hypothetical protein